MNFMDAVKIGFAQIFKFSGRAGRSEYWFFMLFVALAVPFVGYIFGLRAGLISILFLFLPSLAATIRRLHDLDKSEGWAYLGTLILMVGSLCLMLVPLMLLNGDAGYMIFLYAGVTAVFLVFVAMVYFLSRQGTDGDNRFGDRP